MIPAFPVPTLAFLNMPAEALIAFVLGFTGLAFVMWLWSDHAE